MLAVAPHIAPEVPTTPLDERSGLVAALEAPTTEAATVYRGRARGKETCRLTAIRVKLSAESVSADAPRTAQQPLSGPLPSQLSRGRAGAAGPRSAPAHSVPARAQDRSRRGSPRTRSLSRATVWTCLSGCCGRLPAMPSDHPAVGSIHDPDGREVVLLDRIWEERSVVITPNSPHTAMRCSRPSRSQITSSQIPDRTGGGSTAGRSVPAAGCSRS